MKKKHLYGAMLWAFLVTANLCTGCSDDNDYPDVDGQNPTMTLATDHIESGAGHRFTIEGTLEDKDGIASISLQCADLHLNKTIDLIEIYGAPQESYDLSVSIRPRACFSPSYNKVKSQTKHVWLLTLL